MSKGSKSGNSPAVKWQGFVKGRLTAEERELAEVAYVEDVDLFEAVGDLLTGHYKVSLAWDAAKACVMATAFAQGAVMWKGFSLTARGRDWRQALRFLLYRHFTVMGGDWSGYVEEGGDDYLG